MSKPSEIELLRSIASAARWVIDANGDDAVGRDGRARVGINWVMAAGELNEALQTYAQHFEMPTCHQAARAKAAEMDTLLRKAK